VIKTRLASVRSSQKMTFFISSMKTADLEALRELIEAGRVTPVVERSYPLSEIADAMGYLGTGHAQGKLVLTT
jgi:NADPH:quinone reductase-like Zn-dependent oxidoreductase